jgi:hypothetical protein
VRDSKYWNGERENERVLRERLGSFSHKAACVAYGVLEALGVAFAFAAIVALVTVLCA